MPNTIIWRDKSILSHLLLQNVVVIKTCDYTAYVSTWGCLWNCQRLNSVFERFFFLSQNTLLRLCSFEMKCLPVWLINVSGWRPTLQLVWNGSKDHFSADVFSLNGWSVIYNNPFSQINWKRFHLIEHERTCPRQPIDETCVTFPLDFVVISFNHTPPND